MSEALRLAHELILAMRDTDAEHWDTLEEAAAELRRRHQEQDMTAEELLKLCHAYLRGVEINTPQGCSPINPDQLARQINLYLNDNATQEQTHDQDQRDPAGAANQAAA